jgi:gamma-glutamylcyclotransferase (GGCT)/AIG2-like uncharacterized protein YtfP
MSDEAVDLFAYGTLLFPEVMLAVTRARFASEPATLGGYRRCRLRGASYPGIAPAPGARTHGRLYRTVDATSLARLDAFEGELYAREAVRVEADDGELRDAVAYVLRPEHRALLTCDPWDPDAFRASPDFQRFASG